ncbi:Nif3-like dinuclear metal center hexameric protein [Chloroflexota bacterium]
MKQTDLVQQLDSFFSIEAFDETYHWKPKFAERDLSVFQEYAATSFLEGPWNGLMLNHAESLDRVYLIVFPTQDVIDTIIAKEVARGAPGALIFAHHLLNFVPVKRGFDAISTDQLAELREHQISYYVCHAPLDCHPETSTATALANVLGLREQGRFLPLYGGHKAVTGKVGKPVDFQKFATRLAKVTDVEHLRYDQVLHNGRSVSQVAVVSGNGADPALLHEAANLGCDTYVTGQWWFYGESEYAEQSRAAMREAVLETQMNLLGVSRYATEMVVMRDQMPGWFLAQGVDADFIMPDDPWQ